MRRNDCIKKKGFSLLELVVAIIVVSGMAAFAIPSLMIQARKVQNREAIQTLMSVYGSQRNYYRDNGIYSLVQNDLDVDFPALKNFQTLGLNDDQGVNCAGNIGSHDGGNEMFLGSFAAADNSYTLYILEDGRVVCTPCSQSLCLKMGFEAF